MSSGFSWLLGACIALCVGPVHAQLRDRAQLRVCADPNNMPFSNRDRQGFENELAQLIAADLGRQVHYTWWPQRRGFIRNTLAAERCDVVMGVPRSLQAVSTTAAYYRSSYVFVTRAKDALDIRSFDAPALRSARIGVHLVGDDGGGAPPLQALAARGLSEHVRGYSIYGAYSEPDPPRALIDAVAEGEIDVAIAWGPLAGYAASIEPVILEVVPVPSEPSLPMAFDIALGVRPGDAALRSQLDQVLEQRADEIHALLTRFAVPLLPKERVK